MRTKENKIIQFIFDVFFIISFLSVIATPFYIGITTVILADQFPKWLVLVNMLFAIFNMIFFLLLMVVKAKKLEIEADSQK